MPSSCADVILALPAVLLVALAWAAAAAADNGLAPVTPESPNAEAITADLLGDPRGHGRDLRARRRRRSSSSSSASAAAAATASQEGAQIHGATKLEVASTIVPVLILAGITAFVFVKLPTIKNVPEAKAGDRRTCRSASRATSTTGSSRTRAGRWRSSTWSCRSAASSS